MSPEAYRQSSTQLLELAARIEDAKRPAYTFNKTDVLTNFKEVASRIGVTPMQAWAVYFLKHIDAITTYAQSPDIPQGEEISGRFADALNYLKLGHALAEELRGPVEQNSRAE